MKWRFRLARGHPPSDDMGMIRAFQRLVFIAGATGLTVLAFHPYHDGALRYGLPLSLAAVWCAGLLSRGRKGLRCVLLVLPVLCAIPFCLPEKPLDTRDLNRRYVAAMERMRGAPYRWGGESRGGIDCSGLPRRALRDALLEIGGRTGNGAAFRAWAEQWWFDTSAKALAENYRGFTRPLGVSGKLRDLDTVHLSPGDLAVTADGRHVMVLLAGGRWIQADPGPLKVVIERPAVDRNPWFDSFVTVHRWMILE